MSLYPWQNQDYIALVNACEERKLSSLLIYGAANSGCEVLLDQLIAYLLCLNPQNQYACGSCSSCLVLAQKNHLDYYVLAADNSDESKTASIKVEQIRDLINFANKTAHLSLRKVIYLPNLEQLNLNSANALLKILEEPPANCIFILQAKSLNQVLPTILSRCFKYKLTIPEQATALSYLSNLDSKYPEFWLNYFAGEPLFDLPLNDEQLLLLQEKLLKPSIENIFILSRELDPKKIGMEIWNDFLIKWLSDLSRLKLGITPCYFNELHHSMTNLVSRANIEKIYALYDEIIALNVWATHPLNHKLQLENFLFKYQQIYA